MSSLINKMKEKFHVGKDKDDVGTATYNSPSHSGSEKATAQPAHNVAQQPAAVAQPAHNVPAQGSKTQPVQAPVTVHEHDPNWQRARELTHEAEQASKLSAAKAYEAESHLTTAQDAHRKAQEATTRKAELAAQAEAERQNIGAADYVREEMDSTKNKIEEHEKIHIDMNKNLDTTRKLLADKEGELNSVAPVVREHQKEIDTLANKLGSLQGAKADLENKHGAHATHLNQLQDQHGQYANEVARLEAEVERLNLHAKQLEDQARQARATADDKLAKLKSAKAASADIAKEADRTAKGLHNVEKDLDGYKVKEADLSQRLAAAQAAAKEASDLAAAKEAELQLAAQAYEAERQKGLPVAQDIERYNRELHEKERHFKEVQESSKAAKAAHAKFAAAAEQAAKEVADAVKLKEQKLASYRKLKDEAHTANAREAELWNKAKQHGNTGDANALQRLAEAEKTLMETHGGVEQPIVTPEVGPKQPTTPGPKLHRNENVNEAHDTLAKEDVRTHH